MTDLVSEMRLLQRVGVVLCLLQAHEHAAVGVADLADLLVHLPQLHVLRRELGVGGSGHELEQVEAGAHVEDGIIGARAVEGREEDGQVVVRVDGLERVEAARLPVHGQRLAHLLHRHLVVARLRTQDTVVRRCTSKCERPQDH